MKAPNNAAVTIDMREDDERYFEDPEFRESLKMYEEARQNGTPLYMDADELTDIAEYYMVNEREAEADEAIALAVQLHPESVDPQVFLARQEMFRDHLELAHKICDAIQDQDDSEVRFLNAELMIREEKEDEAYDYLIGCYENMMSGRAGFLYDSAGVFMDYAIWDKARMLVKRLLDDYPNYRRGTELMAEVLVAMGDYEEAYRVGLGKRKAYKEKFTAVKIKNIEQGDQAVDNLIKSIAGNMIKNHKYDEIVIVSEDKGYLEIIDKWKKEYNLNSKHIRLCKDIKKALL